MDSIDEQQILHLLHNDIWDEVLLSNYFAFIVDKLLTVKEKQILELKVQGVDNPEIGLVLQISEDTVRRHTVTIKSKFRNKMNLRVDNVVEYKKYKAKIQKKKKKTSRH